MKTRSWWGRGGDELSSACPRSFRRTICVNSKLRTCVFGVILFVCLQFDLSSSIRPLGKCISNGVEYSSGDLIRTTDPCLECICMDSANGSGSDIRCRLRVCPRLPRPPPPSCLLLRRPNTCCELLVCSDGLKNTVQGRSNIESELQQKFHEGCIINGTVYGEGSAMVTSSQCEYCYCIKGKQHCVRPQCILSVAGCIPEYSKHSCCPVKYNCSKETVSIPSSTPPSASGKCEVDGEVFPEGSRLGKMERRSCEKCYCLKGQVHCDPVICELPPLSNCSPVTEEGHCCPVSYNCSSRQSVGTTEKDPDLTSTTVLTPLVEETTTMATSVTEVDTAIIETTTINTDHSVPLMNTGHGMAEERSISTTAMASSLDEATTTFVREESLDVGNSTESPVKLEGKLKVTPEVIEAIINRTLQKEDYDYDYNEPSLPPSLPNLKIIPFVAADAMIRQNEEDPLFSAELVNSKSTESPPTLTFSPVVSHPLGFSPPTETEGGFLPRDPVIDGPFYESKFIESPSAASVAESSLPAITESTKLKEEGKCEQNGLAYDHGEVVNDPNSCNLCICYYGSIHCREQPCNDTNCTGNSCRSSDKEITSVTPASVLPDITSEFPETATVAEIIVTPRPLGEDVLPMAPLSTHSINLTTAAPSSINLTENGFDYDDISLGNIFDILFSSERRPKPNSTKSHLTTSTTTSTLTSTIPPLTTVQPVSFTPSDINSDPALNSIGYNDSDGLDRISLDHSDENLINSQENSPIVDLQLKLAGCNIYGKMYQVGDFVSELSTASSKCKCADSGVQCLNIDH